MKNNLSTFLFFIFILGFNFVKAQELVLPFRNYNTDDGLANSDVYDIIKDKIGNLWLATDNGLSRFDGLRFQNYNVENGLSGSSLTSIAQKEDTLYISCYRKGVQRMVNGVFEKTLYLNFDRIAYIRIARDSVYMFRQASNRVNQSSTFINNDKFNKTRTPIPSANRSSRREFFEVKNQNKLYKNGSFYRNLPTALNQELLYGIDEANDGKLLIGSVGKYFIIDKDNSYQTITSPEIATFKKIDIILRDNKNRTWFRDQYGKAVVEINQKLFSINQLLKIDEGIAIRNVFFDESNGNIWIATGGKGIFCFYNDFIENYLFSQIGIGNKVNTLEIDFKNRLWIGTQDGFLYQSNNKISLFNNPMKWRVGRKIYKFNDDIFLGYGQNINEHFLDEIEFEKQKIVYLLAPFVRIDNHETKSYFILNRNYISFEKKNDANGKSAWYFLNTNLNLVNNTVVYFNPDGTFNKNHRRDINVNALKIESLKNRSIYAYLQQNDTTWVGSNKGLYWLVWSKDRKQVREINPFNHSKVLTSSITEIKLDNAKNIYILTEKGLAIWKNGKTIFEDQTFRGQELLGPTCIEFDKKNRIWLGTKRGLFFFDKHKTFLFNNKNGLNSFEINALKYDEINNQIWIGTNDGLSKINISDLENYCFDSPKLKVLGVSTLLGSFFSSANELVFSTEQNYLQFHLAVSDYISPQTIEYEYTLDGNNWTKTDSVLILPAVSFGKHTIHFRVKNDNSDWSKIEELDFEITPPFYQNWLFWVITSIFFVGLLYAWFENNRKKQQNQLQLKRQIADLKQQGMASMMNPHFIFNALNSIQYYINSNDLILVNEYLSKFGKLIRLNLESSFNNSVSLKNELTFIELYLSLEKLRFGDKFDYQIVVAPNLTTEKLLLPPMFIQPFIENALIHGILPSNRKGKLLLSIKPKENDILEIIIEDNGIGFEAASKLKKSEHTSRSMSIIQQRIAVMNEEVNENSIKFESSSKTEGSVVIIHLKTTQSKA